MLTDDINILLVEDNDDHAEIISRNVLKFCKPKKLLRVEDGQEAIDFLLKTGKFLNSEDYFVPKLILLDIKLPKKDGIEVLQFIKNTPELLSIPVIMLTSSESENDILKSYINHANSYIVKPINFKDFQDLIKDMGIYWFQWNKDTSVK